MQKIQLDCQPGYPRPGDLINEVIKGTELMAKEPESTCFGNWTWDYSEISEEDWGKIQPTLKDRITKLYHS